MSKLDELIKALSDEIASQVLDKVEKSSKKKVGRPKKIGGIKNPPAPRPKMVKKCQEEAVAGNGTTIDEILEEIDIKEEKKETVKRKTSSEDFKIEHNNEITGDAKRQCRRVPFNKASVKNTFKDNQTAHANELVTIRKELGVANPRPRNHRDEDPEKVNTGIKVEVECFICGKQESVSPMLAIGYSKDKEENVYKCNDCSTGKGRRRLN